MFEMINEFEILKEEQEMTKVYPLIESVETLLRNLVAKVKLKPESFLEHIDIEVLAPQLAGLMLLGKKDNREVIQDFGKLEDIDGKKLSKNFYLFLRDIDELHSDKIFDEGLTANKFLNYIGNVHAKSLTEDWKKILQQAKDGEETALTKVKAALTKLNEYYATRYRELTSAFYDKQGEQLGQHQSQSGIEGGLSGLDSEL